MLEDIYPDKEWIELISKLPSGTTVILGPSNVGKSYLSMFLFTKLQKVKRKIALITLDPGQPIVGLPLNLSLSLSNPLRMPYKLKFTGTFSPRKNIAATLSSAKTLLDVAKESLAEYIIVDTCGYISTTEAREYKLHLIETLSPTLVVCIGNKEILPLFKVVRKFFPTILIPPSNKAKVITRQKRRDRRTRKILAHLQNYTLETVPFDQVIDTNCMIASELLKYTTPTATLVGIIDSVNFCKGLGIITNIKEMLEVATAVEIKKEDKILISKERCEDLLHKLGLQSEIRIYKRHLIPVVYPTANED